MRIGTTTVVFHGDTTVTTFEDGRQVVAHPQFDPAYRARAVALGYGGDVALMSREHEVTHSLLAHWLGLPASPTLLGVAAGQHWPHWQAEEAAVLGIQRFARMAGVSLVKL